MGVKEKGSRMVLGVTFHRGLFWTPTKQSTLHGPALSLLHREFWLRWPHLHTICSFSVHSNCMSMGRKWQWLTRESRWAC